MSPRRAVLGLALSTALAGCVSYAPPPAPTVAALQAAPTPAAPPVTVYLVYNGFHSGLTVPTAALRAHPGPTVAALDRLPAAAWTSLGFGDAKFYQHQGINPGRVLDFARSMLKPGNTSVINLHTVTDPLADRSHPHILRILIPADRFGALVARLDASFALQAGAPDFVAYGAGGRSDLFYRGARPASAIHECNQWIGDLLGAAGVPHSPLLDTATSGLAYDLQRRGYATPVA